MLFLFKKIPFPLQFIPLYFVACLKVNKSPYFNPRIKVQNTVSRINTTTKYKKLKTIAPFLCA